MNVDTSCSLVPTNFEDHKEGFQLLVQHAIAISSICPKGRILRRQKVCDKRKRLEPNNHWLGLGLGLGKPWARSIQPKFRPVRPGKEDHLKRWTSFFETFPVGPNRSIEFWNEISGNFG